MRSGLPSSRCVQRRQHFYSVDLPPAVCVCACLCVFAFWGRRARWQALDVCSSVSQIRVPCAYFFSLAANNIIVVPHHEETCRETKHGREHSQQTGIPTDTCVNASQSHVCTLAIHSNEYPFCLLKSRIVLCSSAPSSMWFPSLSLTPSPRRATLSTRPRRVLVELVLTRALPAFARAAF